MQIRVLIRSKMSEKCYINILYKYKHTYQNKISSHKFTTPNKIQLIVLKKLQNMKFNKINQFGSFSWLVRVY